MTRSEIVEALLDAFRTDGFDGASLATISARTGLGRSSLYHHFPDGKAQMAEAVLDAVDGWLEERIVGPLAGPGTPAARLDAMLDELDAFYAGGRRACILERLAASAERQSFAPRLGRAFATWIDAIADLLAEAGVPADVARRRAEDAVARIEGALLIAAATGDTALFARTLADLRAGLLAGGGDEPSPR